MNKKLIFLVVVLVFIVGSAAYLKFNKDVPESTPVPGATPKARSPETPPQDTSPNTKPTEGATKTACEILKLEHAKKVLGDNAKLSDTNKPTSTEVDHFFISTCTYELVTSSQESRRETSLLVRTAKDAEGTANDKAQFTTQKPSNAVDVSGYGDTAYWDVNFGQLHILKGSNWYVLTTGSLQGANRTLDEAKHLADLLKPDL